MAQDTTAIAIVGISAGAVVAIVGGVLNAHLARRQAARQFAHERDMADRAELRAYLREVLATLQDVVDYLLGLSSDLDAVSGISPEFLARASQAVSSRWRRRASRIPPPTEQMSQALSLQAQAISEEIERLRSHVVGLALMVGGRHPLAISFTDLVRRTLACEDAVPEAFPVSDETREEFTKTWEHLADGQRDFLELAAAVVGVKLEAAELTRIVALKSDSSR